MATTKIWPVHDSLKRLVDYASNPEKTEHKGLMNTLKYVQSEGKTESFYFVSGINCSPDNAYEQMVYVKKRFGKLGGNVAYHGYQSFKPGEVTPEQCHEIGVKLASQLWGNEYQILVATHLDREHLHNHFLINSVSFIDGKKFNDNKKTYYNMRDLSDKLCIECGLSIIKSPKGQTPRSIYFDEKNGLPTKYNLMRDAIDKAISSSKTMEQFTKVLGTLGYEFNYKSTRKYATIRSLGSKKSVRLYRLGNNYDMPAIQSRLDRNYTHSFGSPYRSYCMKLSKRLAIKTLKFRVKNKPTHKIGGLKGLYYHYCYLLGYLPRGTNRKPLSPEMKEDWRRINRISEQVRLVNKYNFNSLDDVSKFIDKTTLAIDTVTKERTAIYNKMRRNPDNNLKQSRDECTAKLAAMRKELKAATHILEDNPKIKDNIEKEEIMKPLQKEIIKSELLKKDRDRSR